MPLIWMLKGIHSYDELTTSGPEIMDNSTSKNGVQPSCGTLLGNFLIFYSFLLLSVIPLILLMLNI